MTVVGNKAYIFGGTTAENEIASNDIHAVTLEHSGNPEMDYSLIPALPTKEDGEVPRPRTNHAACEFHGNIAVYGGNDEKEQLIDEGSSVWLFSPERKAWDLLSVTKGDVVPGPRSKAKLFAHDSGMILFGGIDATGDAASDLWKFDPISRKWEQLPTAPVAASNVALANGQLWLLSSNDQMSSQLHHLAIAAPENEMAWESFTFPTNPLVSGPRARHDGALLPLTTGWGRNYMVYLLGAREDFSTIYGQPEKQTRDLTAITQCSDTWILQIPSSDLEAKAAWSLKEAINPAKIKDAIRHAIGAETGHLAWAEAVIQPLSDKEIEEEDGKLHPGPRAFFGADVMEHGHSVVLWGGVNAKGERVGDGWVIKFE